MSARHPSRHPEPHRPAHRPGRHELGQNFLVDPDVVRAVVDLVAAHPHGPVVEWGAGDGALTLALAGLGVPVEAVEIDARRAARLRRRVPPHVCVTEGDLLRHAPPPGSTVVSNVPFHLTTPVLRRLLGRPQWERAVLLVQWEVARKRAGVGGATQLTAQWWPWFTFRLERRVEAAAFRPRPSVDAGLLTVDRRDSPLVDSRADYQAWVRRVFTGPGRGLPEVLRRAHPDRSRALRDWCRRHRVTPRHLPRDLDAEQWADLYRLLHPAGPGSRARRRPR